MPQRRGVRLHRLDRRHQIAQHIDHVDRLVHQRSAAVHLPGPVPRIPVVLVGPPPGHVDAGIRDRPEPPRADRIAQRNHQVVEPVGEDPSEARARLLVRFDHRIDAVQLDLQGLLAQHVLARLGRRDRRLHVQPAWRRDGHDVHVVAPDHLLVAVVGLGAILVRQCLSPIDDLVATGRELRIRDIANRPGMKIRDQPRSHDSKIPRLHRLSSPQPAFITAPLVILNEA